MEEVESDVLGKRVSMENCFPLSKTVIALFPNTDLIQVFKNWAVPVDNN